jgi:hypothetical protein
LELKMRSLVCTLLVTYLGVLYSVQPVVKPANADGGKESKSSPRAAYDIENAADVDNAIAKTFGPRKPPLDLSPLTAAWKGIGKDSAPPPVKIIFDTDIGTHRPL